MKEYKVKEIYEADFGCEGLPEGQRLKVVVRLVDMDGNETSIQAEDEWLIKQDINEGSMVVMDMEGRLLRHKNCLIVDDETELADATREYFELFGVTCDTVADGQSCLENLENGSYDLILLDINLADESGFKLCKTIRERWNMPILFVSARQSDEDVLVALNIGGDDYIKKPYTLSILLAKVKAVLKRAEINESNRLNINSNTQNKENKADEANNRLGNNDDNKLRLEEASLKAYIDGREVSLKAKEFKLLKCLYDNRNTIVKKETLFDMVWGDTYFSDGTLNVHIRKLREKLEKNPNEPELIKTIWGTGYILELR